MTPFSFAAGELALSELTPPPEVRRQIARAARLADQLAATGHAVRFTTDDASGRVSAELTDPQGSVLGVLPLTTVLELASGPDID